MTCKEFIESNIDFTTKTTAGREEDKTLIQVPYPYSIPCANGAFQEMYYWDTYFTNKALFALGRGEQAVHNIRNIGYMVDTYGKMLNGTRTFYLNRSQPPFFGCMIEDALRYTPHLLGVEEAFVWLEKEYAFWQAKRSTPVGLNAYACDFTEEEAGDILDIYSRRTGITLAKTEENYRHVYGECESGWDFSPRFSSACADHCAIDLNSLLYKDERLLGEWATTLGYAEKAAYYKQKAEERRAKILQYCYKDGILYDYNYKTGVCSKVVSCAALFAYWLGVDCDKGAFERTLARLEGEYGVYACDDDNGGYQWSKPNSWAPLNWVAVAAASALGERQTEVRLAKKYVGAIEKIFAETGNLWEKYNGISGNLDVASEYGTPPMLGWTAGVYLDLLQIAKE